MTESAVTEPSVVRWNAPSRAPHPARDAAFRSYDAVIRKDKEAWLANFADDGWIEDPVGPSMFDEEGKGHHGADGRAHFYDLTIATVARFEFEINDSFACASECVNVGVIHTTLSNGYRARCEGVFHYTVNDEGKIRSLRAFWELDRMMKTVQPPP
ncbi:MAG: steroid Delta-isomerase [Pseudonocardiales bacterium]|jgi:ketosteroid isomerase-like protein|nr:steroid Delta-isomerase [Pseudonocardiales bacterium]